MNYTRARKGLRIDSLNELIHKMAGLIQEWMPQLHCSYQTKKNHPARSNTSETQGT